MTFAPNEIIKAVEVIIADDAAIENLETFSGNLMISPESSTIAEVTVPLATVNIEDDDRKFFRVDECNVEITECIQQWFSLILCSFMPHSFAFYKHELTWEIQISPF